MHHPEICNIVRILDDYFLLLDPESRCTIQGRKADGGNDDSVFIRRDLKNGYLEVEIDGNDKDDDRVQIRYYRSGSQRQWDLRESVSDDNFSLGAVRKVVRQVVLFDAQPPEPDENDRQVQSWMKE
jgi:hypothetical protein